MRWVTGMALARVGIKGHLSMKRNMLKFKSNEVLKNKTSGQKREKPRKKKKLRKPGCHKPTPLRINLVLEIWLLREPSKTYRPSATCCFSVFFFLLHIVPTVASNIFEGVYFTRSTVLTEGSSHSFLLISILISSDLHENWMSCHQPNTVDTHTIFGISQASFVVWS